MRISGRRRIGWVIGIGMATIGSLLAVAPSASADDGPEYVNLGDSYSAGSGILPLAAGISPLCTQTSSNWAHDIAKETGMTLKDVSCGGAQTKDFASSQFPGVAPQLDALSSSTKLVTLSIGGNDNNTFIGAIAACGSAGATTLGYGSPCKDRYGDQFVDTVRTSTYDNLVNAFSALRHRAPNARIVVADYLTTLPPTDGCFFKMPIAKGDVPYLDNLQQVLSETIHKAADTTGVEFLSFAGISAGHDACKPVGTRWVEPAFGGTNYVPVHPNAVGEQAMADYAIDQLGLN